MKVMGLITGTVLTLSAALPSAAQRLLDWPVRTSALPEAVVTGAGAVFWNPAGLVASRYRVDALGISLRTPDDWGVSGLAFGVVSGFQRTVLAVGYEHVGLEPITATESSVDPVSELELAEDHFTLAASQQVGRTARVGALARYTRDNLDATDAVVAIGAGAQLELGGRFTPRVGAYAVSEADEVSWAAGAEVRLPALLGRDFQFGAGYGAADQGDGLLGHRVTGVVQWREQASVNIGVLREGGADQAAWQPALAASLRLTRYTVGVVRESLSNDVGATYTFRLQVGIGK